MQTYIVGVRPFPGDTYGVYYITDAKTAEKAAEAALKAYPGSEIISVEIFEGE